LGSDQLKTVVVAAHKATFNDSYNFATNQQHTNFPDKKEEKETKEVTPEKKEVVCFFCNKPNHYASECFQKRNQVRSRSMPGRSNSFGQNRNLSELNRFNTFQSNSNLSPSTRFNTLEQATNNFHPLNRFNSYIQNGNNNPYNLGSNRYYNNLANATSNTRILLNQSIHK
jgi:hypothetical protein